MKNNLTAIICDSHFGARGDSPTFQNYFKAFYTDIFFPYLEKSGITEIYHLGDLVDRRKYINYSTYNIMRNNFLDVIEQKNYKLNIIPGNHDCYYRSTNDVNAITEIASSYSSINVINKPTIVNGIGMVPWISPENQKECLDFLQKSNINIIAGHFEINGFEVHKGQVCDFGLNSELFNKFDLTMSGHFHHKSTHKNINYLGSPYEITWVDCDDPKGFHILNKNNCKLKFIKNPYSIYKKINMEDSIDECGNKFIKLYVSDKFSSSDIDNKIKELNLIGCLDVQIIDNSLKIDIDASDKISVNTDSVLDILLSYSDNTEDEQLKTFLTFLYEEAEKTRDDI